MSGTPGRPPRGCVLGLGSWVSGDPERGSAEEALCYPECQRLREASLLGTGEPLAPLKVTQPHLQVPSKRPLPETLDTLSPLSDPSILLVPSV